MLHILGKALRYGKYNSEFRYAGWNFWDCCPEFVPQVTKLERLNNPGTFVFDFTARRRYDQEKYLWPCNFDWFNRKLECVGLPLAVY